MSIESPLNHTKNNVQDLVATEIDENGIGVYEPVSKDLGYREIPDNIFKDVISDFQILEEDNTILKFKKRELLFLAINSNKKAHYEVGDAKKGHYFLVKSISDSDNPNILTVELSKGKRVMPNPDVVVCSQAELDNWLNS